MVVVEEMVDTRGIEARGATNDAVHLVPFFKQQLCPGEQRVSTTEVTRAKKRHKQVRSILASDTYVNMRSSVC